MAGETSRFRRGAIRLGEDDEDALVPPQAAAKTPALWVTSILYWLMICASIVGLSSLLWALAIIDSYDWDNDARRFFHQAFKEKFSPVTGLLLMSVFWAPINLLSLRKQRETLPGIFGNMYDILMIVALIHFPTVCCSWLHDKWDTLACEYAKLHSVECLPVYVKILRTEITGLVCAYLVALFYLLLIIVRVTTLILDLHGKGRSSPLGRWLYQRGYSTAIAIYCISGSLSIVGFGLMMWVYSSMLSLGGRVGHGSGIWGAHFHAGFGFLTILLLTVPIWLIANFLSMCAFRKTLTPTIANIYDSFIGTGLGWISLRAAKFLDALPRSCAGYDDGDCKSIWTGLRPRHVAVILLGVLVGVIHLVLFLIRLSIHIRSTRGENEVTVVILRDLDTSTWSEDRLAALSYALRGPEHDLEVEAAVEMAAESAVDEEEQQPSLQEAFPFLTSFGKFFGRVKVMLPGSTTAPREDEEEVDEFTALLSADMQDGIDAEESDVEETEVSVLDRNIDLESSAETARPGVIAENTGSPGIKSMDKPLPPSPTEDGNRN